VDLRTLRRGEHHRGPRKDRGRCDRDVRNGQRRGQRTLRVGRVRVAAMIHARVAGADVGLIGSLFRRAASSVVEHLTFNQVVLGSIPRRPTINQRMRRTAFVYMTTSGLLVAACGGGSSPTSPSQSRLQVAVTTQAPDRCSGPCLRLAWIDQGSVGSQGLLRIAVQVQNIPSRGISSVSNILSGIAVGTFSGSSPALAFSTSSAGDFFERLGKPVRYEASDIGTTLSNCCFTTYSAGFPNPTSTDRVSGDGTVIVLVYRVRQAGALDLDPGVGIEGDVLLATYTARVQVSGS
jgi:hypothetical protein